MGFFVENGGPIGIFISMALFLNQFIANQDGKYWNNVFDYGIFFLIVPAILLILYLALVVTASRGLDRGTLGFLIAEVNLGRKLKLWVVAAVFVAVLGLVTAFAADSIDGGVDLDPPAVFDVIFKFLVIIGICFALFPTHERLEVEKLRASELPVRVKIKKTQSSTDTLIDLLMGVIMFGRAPSEDNADTKELHELFGDLNDDEVRVLAYNLINMLQA